MPPLHGPGLTFPLRGAFGAAARSPYEAEIVRATQRVLVDRLMSLAGSAGMPQVRAVASYWLARRMAALSRVRLAATEADRAHAALLARDIKRFLERPAEAYRPQAIPAPPPGAPIGEPGIGWLERLDLR